MQWLDKSLHGCNDAAGTGARGGCRSSALRRESRTVGRTRCCRRAASAAYGSTPRRRRCRRRGAAPTIAIVDLQICRGEEERRTLRKESNAINTSEFSTRARWHHFLVPITLTVKIKEPRRTCSARRILSATLARPVREELLARVQPSYPLFLFNPSKSLLKYCRRLVARGDQALELGHEDPDLAVRDIKGEGHSHRDRARLSLRHAEVHHVQDARAELAENDLAVEVLYLFGPFRAAKREGEGGARGGGVGWGGVRGGRARRRNRRG